jgi:hypothetical protein
MDWPSASNGNFRFQANGGGYDNPADCRVVKASEASPFHNLGPEASVAYNPYAPPDEVEDASGRLGRIYSQHAAGAIDPGFYAMMQQFAGMQRSERHANDILAKAYKIVHGIEEDDNDHVPGRAKTHSWASNFGKGAFKWYIKQGVQLPILRAFAKKLEVHRAFLSVRQRQIDRFSQRSSAIDKIGWRLTTRDEEQEATGEIKEAMKWIARCLECGGREFDPVLRRKYDRQGFTMFMRHLVQDGLELDNAACELIGVQNSNALDWWRICNSETFMLANKQYGGETDLGQEIYAYQVLTGQAEVDFSHDQLAIWIRNKSTWAEENGYGYSEFEQTIDSINNIVQAVAYTKQGLSDSAMPRGILMMYGNYDRQTQDAFKQAWAAKVRGVQNQFGLPVLFSRGSQGQVQYLQTGQPFTEMAFQKWMSFCFTIAGAIYGISPEEMGMEGFTADKSSLSGDDTVEKLAAARDKGLNPLLIHSSHFISDELIYRYHPDIKLQWTGLDPKEQTWWQDKLKTMTINEVRKSLDMPPHPISWFGELPYDTGQQQAEFQRMQATLSFGEARKVWGQLPEYPSPMVELTPIAPSMGGVFMQSLMVPPDEGGDGQEQAGGADDGQDEGGMQDRGALVAQRLKTLGMSGFAGTDKGQEDQGGGEETQDQQEQPDKVGAEERR